MLDINKPNSLFLRSLAVAYYLLPIGKTLPAQVCMCTEELGRIDVWPKLLKVHDGQLYLTRSANGLQINISYLWPEEKTWAH